VFKEAVGSGERTVRGDELWWASAVNHNDRMAEDVLLLNPYREADEARTR